MFVFWLACRSLAPDGSAAEWPAAEPHLHPAHVRTVEVRAANRRWSATQRRLLAREEVAALVRESALDWLEAQRRLQPDGSISVSVEISELRLRSAFTALVFAGLAGRDCLAARVSVFDGGAPISRYAVRVESALGGRDWRDPEVRLARLARLLGRRVADSL